MRNVPDRCCSYSQSKIGTDSNRDQHESAFNPKQGDDYNEWFHLAVC